MILAHLTDLHVRPTGLAAYRVAETNMLTERALRTVRNLANKPDAVVISGDLTDNGLVSEYDLLSEMFGRLLNIPVFVIPGNHDRREVMKVSLGHLHGVGDHPDFVQYVVEDLPVRLVMLDTVIPGSSAGRLCAARLSWLDAKLAEMPGKPTLVVMHHPPFACGIRHMDRIALLEPSEFAEVITRHGQVRRILCGHHHRSINAAFAHTIASIGPSVAHQVEFVLGEEPGMWNLEPAAFQILVTMPDMNIVAHTVYVEQFPGPFPFLPEPEYPGR